MAVKNSSKHHQVTFDSPVKSIIPGTNDDLILIETSNLSEKEQTFLLLSLDKMEILQAISFGQDYPGMVVKSFNTRELLLIQYSNQNNPDQTNIYKFNWNGGDPTFSLHNTRIMKTGRDWIQVPHPHFTEKSVYLDLDSGTELRETPISNENDSLASIAYATVYPDSSEYFQWFKQYFSNHDILPYRQIEYLKTAHHMLISFYQEQKEGLDHYLAIIDKEGQIMERILLDEHLSGIGRDNFFVLINKAIFVTKKRTLNIYEL